MESSKTISNRPAPDSLSTLNATDQLYFRICMQCQQKKFNCKGGRPGVSSCNHCSSKGLDCAWIPVLEQNEEQQKAYRLLSSDEGECEFSLKRPKTVSFSSSDEKPKLACPYYKRNPEIHKIKVSCAESGYPDIHRLKQHLERVHRLSPHCQRCYAHFDSEREVENHLQAEKACQRSEPPEDSKRYSKTKEALLNKKAHRGETDAEKWKEIYMILFPRDDECSIPDPYRGDQKPAQAASDNSQQYKQHFRQGLHRIVKGFENLIVDEYGPLKEGFRAKLYTYAHQSQNEVFASLAMPSQGACRATGASMRATGTDKRLVPIFPATDANAHPKEAVASSWAIGPRPKDGIDISALQRAGVYDAPSLLAQEKNQSDLAGDKDNKPHQANSKSMQQVAAKDAQRCNPFRDSFTSSSHSSLPLFMLPQDIQVDDGVDVNLPNPASTIQNFTPAYSMPILEGTTAPPSFISPAPSRNPFMPSVPSTNPFLSPQVWNHRSSRPTGPVQSLNQHGVNPRWGLEQDWTQDFSTGGI